jgi:hypothetical protein
MKCFECDSEIIPKSHRSESSTLVAYMSPPGHDHDDNCISRTYYCEQGHVNILTIQRRCPNPSCDWVGKEKCFCHLDRKVKEWPE